MTENMESFYSEKMLFEGSLLEEGAGSEMWGPDMTLFGSKVEMSTSFVQTAPEIYEEGLKESQIPIGLSAQMSDWTTSEKMDLCLENLVDNGDFLGLMNADSCKVAQPASPSDSYDSGVASPGTSYSPQSYESCSPGSAFDLNDGYLCIDNFALPDVNNSHCAGESFEQSRSEEIDISEDLLAELGIEILPENSPAENVPFQSAATALLQVPVAAEPCGALEEIDTRSLEEILPSCTAELTALLTNSAKYTNSPVVPAAIPVAQEPSKAKPGRKSKITSTHERKQRKRDQNKNAATRYRERKRKELEEREKEFQKLDDKNKSLHDKVSQISREIDYLKELMIEVYTIKGLIP